MKLKPDHLVLIQSGKIVDQVPFEEQNTTPDERIIMADKTGIDWEYLTITNSKPQLFGHTDTVLAHNRNNDYFNLDRTDMTKATKTEPMPPVVE